MPKTKPLFLTAEGAAKIRDELENLKGPQRASISRRLREAIQMGDLSENADYHKAKEDQSFLEGRIQELEFTLRVATIITETDVPRDIVAVGAHVTVQEEGNGNQEYFLVGAKEADSRAGKISDESPIGKALVGHSVGEIVDVLTPNGAIKLIIIKIE